MLDQCMSRGLFCRLHLEPFWVGETRIVVLRSLLGFVMGVVEG